MFQVVTRKSGTTIICTRNRIQHYAHRSINKRHTHGKHCTLDTGRKSLCTDSTSLHTGNSLCTDSSSLHSGTNSPVCAGYSLHTHSHGHNSLHTRTFNTTAPLPLVIRRTFSQVPDKKDTPQPPMSNGTNIPSTSKQQKEQQVTPSSKSGAGPLAAPPRRRRKPTVEEEIKWTKKYDIKRGLLWILLGLIIKIAYDAYYNHVQQQLYADPKAVETLWNQVGEDTWLEGKLTRAVQQRYGNKVHMTGPLTATKNRQLRYWGTTDYLNKVNMFFLRFRLRIWEDVGTLQITAPVAGSKLSGQLHLRAFTQDDNWVLEKAWLEDEDMIIELKRRIDLDFLMNPDAEFLIEASKQQRETMR